MRGPWCVLAAALALTACATAPPANPTVQITAVPVPLNPADPAQDRVSGFVYAGGVQLTAVASQRLHGLSDLKITPDGRLTAIGDEGDFLTARLNLDAAGRLTGIKDVRLSRLTAEDGAPLSDKFEADAEGLAFLPGGDRLVSFEHHHRILNYPARGGPPSAAPMPNETFAPNEGLEALAPLPWVAPDAYVTGAETSGRTWVCRLSAACAPGTPADLPPAAGLVAIAPMPDGRTAWLMRAWSPALGNRVTLSFRDANNAELDRMYLADPLTVDNFEGVAILPGPHGTLRFYILSDDNFSPTQRTLLLAFDWTRP